MFPERMLSVTVSATSPARVGIDIPPPSSPTVLPEIVLLVIVTSTLKLALALIPPPSSRAMLPEIVLLVTVTFA